MPAIHKGYSKAHDEHYQWAYCRVLDCHFRLSIIGYEMCWVQSSTKDFIPNFGKPWNIFSVWSTKDYSKPGSRFWGKGVLKSGIQYDKQMYVEAKFRDNINKPSTSLFNFWFSRHYAYLMKHGIDFRVHYYRGELRSICVCLSKYKGEKYQCIMLRKNGKTTKGCFAGKNLYKLDEMFDAFGWDINERWSWFEVLLSENHSLVAWEMLEYAFENQKS